MDNREIGEVSFVAGGRQYTLRYTSAAWIALEEHLGRGMFDVLDELLSYSPPFDAKGKALPETHAATIQRLKRMKLGFIRAVFWAGFHDGHKDVSLEQAGDLMKEVGGMVGAYNLIMTGAAAAQPEQGKAGVGSPPRPRRRSSGSRTGSAS